jgi:hypothetical protein
MVSPPREPCRIKGIRKTVPPEKMWAEVWDEVVVKVEGMAQEEASGVEVAVKGDAVKNRAEVNLCRADHY